MTPRPQISQGGPISALYPIATYNTSGAIKFKINKNICYY